MKDLGKLPAMAMAVTLAIIFIGLGVYITSQMGTQANVTVLSTLSNTFGNWATTWFPIILIVVAASIIIGLLVRGFGR